MVASVVQCSAVVTGAVAAGPVTAPPPVTHRPSPIEGGGSPYRSRCWQ